MSTSIHQTNLGPIKVQSIESTNGTEIGISQPTLSGLHTYYVEVRCSIDSLPELISALQEELDFLRPQRGTLVHPGQGQLFDPNDL